MEEEEYEGGASFGKIFHTIGKRIWWILGISALVALVAALLTMFVINPSKAKTYSMTFMIEYPNGESMIYPDGTIFRYESIIYNENLEAVYAANPDFSNISISKMKITITEEMRGSEENPTCTGIYTIEIKGGNIKNQEQATSFIRSVCDYSIAKLNEIVEKMDFGIRPTEDAAGNVTYEFTTYDILQSYSERLSRIESQQEYLLSMYEKYTGKYGDIKYNGKALSTYYSEAAAALNGEVRIGILKMELITNQYLLPQQKKNDILITISGLNREKQRNQTQIDALTTEYGALIGQLQGSEQNPTITDSFAAFLTRIATLTARNAEIEEDIKDHYISIGYEPVYDGDKIVDWVEPAGGGQLSHSEEFDSKLQQLYDKIVQQTVICKEVVTNLYQTQSKIAYHEKVAVIESGEMNTIILTIVGFVGGFILAAIVFYFVDNRKGAAQETGKEGVQVIKSNAEAEAEAAVTKSEEE